MAQLGGFELLGLHLETPDLSYRFVSTYQKYHNSILTSISHYAHVVQSNRESPPSILNFVYEGLRCLS